MSRFNTGNPLGSGDPRDLDDNAKNMDLAVNSEESQWLDRFGRPRLPLMEQERQFVAAQERHEDEFQSAQEDRSNRFNDFIASSGYQFVGDYGPGIEITEYNQLVRDSNGEFWRVSGQVDLPYVTTGAGIPEDDALVPAGDAVLRQDLANPDMGAAMVGRGVVAVGSIADLLDLPANQVGADLHYSVGGVTYSHDGEEFSLDTVNERSWYVEDAVWSWWANPCAIAHDGLTYASYSTSKGGLAVAVASQNKGYQKSITLASDGEWDTDDHNTGAIAVDDNHFAVFHSGRRQLLADSRKAMIYYWAGPDVTRLERRQIPATGITDYPNAYPVDGEILLFYRTNNFEGNWHCRIGSWPTGEWQPQRLMAITTETWMYLASKRSIADPKTINIAMGYNLTQSQGRGLYVGKITKESGGWITKDHSGAVIGNLSTGDGGIVESSLTQIYQCGENEQVRLLDVSDDCVLIASYPEKVYHGPGVYKEIRYDGSAWVVRDIVATGEEFLDDNYTGGASYSASTTDNLWLSREDSGYWYIESWVFADGAWTLDDTLEVCKEVAARPRSVANSDEFLYFKGYYSKTDFTDFKTVIKTPDYGSVPAKISTSPIENYSRTEIPAPYGSHYLMGKSLEKRGVVNGQATIFLIGRWGGAAPAAQHAADLTLTIHRAGGVGGAQIIDGEVTVRSTGNATDYVLFANGSVRSRYASVADRIEPVICKYRGNWYTAIRFNGVEFNSVMASVATSIRCSGTYTSDVQYGDELILVPESAVTDVADAGGQEITVPVATPWTPVLLGDGHVYSQNRGFLVYNQGVVTAEFELVASTVNNAGNTGPIRIAGLPFRPLSVRSVGVTLGDFSPASLPAGTNNILGQLLRGLGGEWAEIGFNLTTDGSPTTVAATYNAASFGGSITVCGSVSFIA